VVVVAVVVVVTVAVCGGSVIFGISVFLGFSEFFRSSSAVLNPVFEETRRFLILVLLSPFLGGFVLCKEGKPADK